MVSPLKASATGQVAHTLSAATHALPAPISVVDVAAFDENARSLAVRAHGKPIRIATKSLRNRTLIDRALATPGFQGLMCYSLREALWLVDQGYTDILLAYPTVDAGAIAELAHNERALAEIVVMVDCVEHVERLVAAAPVRPVKIALDVDCSLRVFEGLRNPIHLGVRRSPLHTALEVQEFLAQVAGAARFRDVEIRGAMFYDAQIAGMPDTSWAVRTMKRISRVELAERRAEIVASIELRVGDLELVNAGGTGSVGDYERAPEVTEVTAGSGLYAPALFDGYRNLGVRPAAYFGLDVVRHPRAGIFTAFAGGYVASGPPHTSRQPKPFDAAFRTLGNEGVGEVQTPLRVARGGVLGGVAGRLGGAGGARPAIGDRVWFRHAKAGEQMERFNVTYLLEGSQIIDETPTYRGEGKNFG